MKLDHVEKRTHDPFLKMAAALMANDVDYLRHITPEIRSKLIVDIAKQLRVVAEGNWK